MGIITSTLAKIQAFRQKNLDRRAAIAKVKRRIQETETKSTPDEINQEAVSIQTKYGVTYQEALEYVISEKKSASRKESLRKLANSLHEVGQAAKDSNAERMKQDQSLIFQPNDIRKSKIFKN